MIKLPKLMEKSRNTEVNAVTERISTSFHQKLKSDPILTPLFIEIDCKNKELTTAVKRMKVESDLEAKDELRDVAHHALYHFIFGLTYSSTAAVTDAAAKIFTVLEHYGLSVTEESYDVETSKLDSLLLDLASPKLKASIDALNGAAALIATLKSSQDGFKAVRLAFKQEWSGEGQGYNASSLKREVLSLLNNKLLPVLDGLLVSAPGTYSWFGTDVAEIIATNNETVKQRKKQRPKPADKIYVSGNFYWF